MSGAKTILSCCDNLQFMHRLPDRHFKLIVTSPPYNLGKVYEKTRSGLDIYLATQKRVIAECVRLLDDQGSICWQVGNYVQSGAIVPLDTLLYPLFAGHGLKLRKPCCMALWAWAPLHQTIVWTLRDDKLVDQDGRLHMESRSYQGSVEVHQQTIFKGVKRWQGCLAIPKARTPAIFGCSQM